MVYYKYFKAVLALSRRNRTSILTELTSKTLAMNTEYLLSTSNIASATVRLRHGDPETHAPTSLRSNTARLSMHGQDKLTSLSWKEALAMGEPPRTRPPGKSIHDCQAYLSMGTLQRGGLQRS